MDFFHVLNCGVDKRKVFMNDSDYTRFVHDLWEFNDTAPADENLARSLRGKVPDELSKRRHMTDVRRPSYRKREVLVKVHMFCLMPNHYHLLLSPVDDDMENLSLFMKKLNGGYAKYFNEKYERSGALWQGKYKKVAVETDAHFLHLPYYIHFNALDLFAPEWRAQCPASPKKALDFLKTYRWSSHRDYLGEKNFPSVTDRKFFLEFFGSEKRYAASTAKMLGTDMEKIVDVALE